ncbi:concanavalin A-like lectin/glucanase domain-containing protein [Lasiosphaeria miniovina]|uniref:Concanavalin A-like lectin/glucanase domain-containing protein n=1 Tax=Lasiosphaeria miniovina TaxID=1954250 RepID=A0AA40E560_9PEZI|nr:concanavalin A-like lectin/glucanase domain-containing protein [Lasiosphaeria miniovina]KAK0722868.1 concanavalin A-like lectin/glucanase domain-containing protein [Lasiosphaeria miniovina]
MRLPATLSSLIILLSASVPLAAAGPSLTQDSQCGCYLTNGTDPSFFSKHMFLDFRNLSQYAGVPATITGWDENAAAPPSSQYFSSAEWSNTWLTGSWNNSGRERSDASTDMVNSPNNVYIEANNDKNPSSQTWLTLRTQRLAAFQTAAEIESVSMGFQFLSMRMLARTVGASGAITAMFTYRGGKKLADVQESDLEVRTLDSKNLIHYTNQPSYTADGNTVDQATKNATMPDGLQWTDWAVHRLDWTPTKSVWFVNEQEVAEISFQTPRDGCKVILNAWSDGGQWTGNMSVNASAYLQVQWLDLIYNSTAEPPPPSSAKRDGDTVSPLVGRDQAAAACNAVCSIDETPTQGQPVMLWNNEGPRSSNTSATTSSGRGSLAAWIPSVLISTMVLLSTSLVL